LTGRGNLIDLVMPALAFAVVNTTAGLRSATFSAVGLGAAFAVYRLARRQPLRYAFAGLGAALGSSAIVLLLDRAEGYFLPGLATGGLTGAACVVSVLLRKPLVAWTSHLARRWPREWYWHPLVRPAYSEVTLAWGVFFAARVALQLALLFRGQSALLGAASVAAGWPATVFLLITSYLYGTRRLRSLGGPSVREFTSGAEPPWEGQHRGF
jgi:hypothetical protein